ncbi:MAG TPA: hypothetical protein EYP86_04260 [Candidatus Altiarchaeales archaeon]|nr:hypothetical protein [Candidatus Altiarchaeales archaeon]
MNYSLKLRTKPIIIPVIDVKGGIAVGAIAGNRNEYRELRSSICKSSDPFEVAMTYQRLGFSSIYIADLDGILNSQPNIELIKRIYRNTSMRVYYDIGTWSIQDIKTLDGVIPVIATETMSSLNLLGFPKDFVLSIDTRDGNLLCEMAIDLKGIVDIVRGSKRIKEVIIIDLLRVGMSEGPNLGLCEYVLKNLPDKKVIYGGGIRNLNDIYSLIRLGIHRVIVGSALHNGRIRIENL